MILKRARNFLFKTIIKCLIVIVPVIFFSIPAYASEAAASAPAFVRLTEQGFIDPTFNSGKGVFTYVKADQEIAGINSIYSDYRNRIVTLGGMDFTFTRFLRNGKLDIGFNFHGIQRIKPNKSELKFSNGINIRKRLKLSHSIIALGTGMRPIGPSLETRTVMMRLTEFGALDHTFGEEGVVDLARELGLQRDTFKPVSIVDLPDDRYIMFTEISKVSGGGFQLALVALNSNGTVASNYGDNGIVRINIDRNVSAVKLLEFGAHWYLVTRSAPTETKRGGILIVRVNRETGELDSDYANNGILETVFNTGDINVTSASMYADRMVVAGQIADGVGVAVYKRDTGQLDLNFSGDGKRVIRKDEHFLKVADVVVNHQNKVFIGGTATKQGAGSGLMFIAVLENDGGFDSATSLRSFTGFTNPDGQVPAKVLGYTAKTMYLEPEGGILLGGNMNYAR